MQQSSLEVKLCQSYWLRHYSLFSATKSVLWKNTVQLANEIELFFDIKLG